MYLKHISHTHNIDFSPNPCVLPSPPASKSDVRPCDRAVARLTPGILSDCVVDDEDPCGVEGSSASVSVNGYGEKYLEAE